MRKTYLYIIFLLSIWGNAYSQTFTANETYVYTRVYLDTVASGTASATAQSVRTVQYDDGLGRLRQSIIIKGSAMGKDLVTSYFYNEGGSMTKQYMPIAQNTQNGKLQTVTEAGINSYHGVANAYGEVLYDNSPQNRVVKSASPGADWSMDSGHTREFTYGLNAANVVKKYVATANTSTFQNTLGTSGYYAANTLHKTVVKDEDGNLSEEYSNDTGQVLMTRVKNGAVNLDTYYVYNQYNQLAYTIPPLNSGENPVNVTVRNKIVYQYTYDAYGRLTEKKLPGKGKEYYVYDRENRVIMSTDSRLIAEGKWSFVKYDKAGRVVYTGLCTGGERTSEQTAANGASAVYETRTTSPGFTNSSLPVYYTKSTYPTAVTDVLSVNYYDQYPPAMPVSKPASIYAQTTLSGAVTDSHSTKGMLTASYVRNVENSSWSKTYMWYDTKERLAGSYKDNYLTGYTKTEMKLDFPGNITESKVYHKRTSSDTETVVRQRYKYSEQNLLLKHYHKVDNQAEVLLAEMTYDDLGRMTRKKVGNNLQTVDYTYNIRGWLTAINDMNNLGSDLFGYKISYNTREGVETPNNDYSSLKVKPRYNGSIAETAWATSSGSIERYGYAYDGAGMMLAGFYQSPANPYQKSHSEVVTYDNRGNIKNLYRTSYKPTTGNVRVIDDLAYTYDGNTVTKIDDHSMNMNGYEGGGGPITYDVNGNMTSMPDKGITDITYNFLNLPSSVTDVVGTTYLYSADGTKLRKALTVYDGQQDVNVVTEYLDGFQYSTPNTELVNSLLRGANPNAESLKNASEPEAYKLEQKGIGGGGNENEFIINLVFFPTAEGFYDYENKRYIYQYKDQLGNVRISYTKDTNGTPKVLDTNKYYAFGMNHLGGSDPSIFDPLAIPYNYKYNGKELQETGMYDYGWRMYMPDIGRWNGIDQLAEKYMPVSPYAYVLNNPVSLTDPDGRDVHEGEDGWTFTGAEMYALIDYLGNGGSYGNLVSNLENGTLDFGNGPVNTHWHSYDPPGTWVGRTWRNIIGLFGWKPKPIISAGLVTVLEEDGDVFLEGEDVKDLEPDWLNINNTGFDIGLGIKDFKFGPLKISADLSAFSLLYDKSAGGFNMTIGELEVGAYLGDVGIDLSGRLYNIDSDGREQYGNGSVRAGVWGVTREAATGSVYDSQGGWFSGNTLSSPLYPSNRMVDIGNGQNVPMLILGGTVHIGVFSTDVEVNVDQIMSGPLGGSGVGSDWK